MTISVSFKILRNPIFGVSLYFLILKGDNSVDSKG